VTGRGERGDDGTDNRRETRGVAVVSVGAMRARTIIEQRRGKSAYRDGMDEPRGSSLPVELYVKSSGRLREVGGG